MQVVSMAKSVSEKEDAARPMTDPIPLEKIPDYPYGLTIYIGTEEMKKLGLNADGLKSGQRVTGQFVGQVTDTSATMVNGLTQYRCSIQIQDLGLEQQAEKPASEIMYGKETA